MEHPLIEDLHKHGWREKSVSRIYGNEDRSMSVIIHGDMVDASIIILGNKAPMYVPIRENISTKDQLFDRIRAQIAKHGFNPKQREKVDKGINMLEEMFDKEVA